MILSIGICVGASTISVAERTAAGLRLGGRPHDGEVERRLTALVGGLETAQVGITGRKFRRLLAVPTVSEPEAVELAFASVKARYPATDCIVSAGGETFIAYVLDPRGRIRTVHTGNKCAAGTGEFFLQQVRRMGLEVEEALKLAAAQPAYDVAGRCSVFCKSDCTHALNKGVPKGQVVAGLCRMMAGKIIELLQKTDVQRVAVVGGVSRNRVVLDLLREAYPQVYVPAEAQGFEAMGALLWAEERGEGPKRLPNPFIAVPRSFGELPPLREGLEQVSFRSAPRGELLAGEYAVGLDVGSTTTKAVLVRCDSRAIVASAYLRTDGDPVRASRECYRQLQEQVPSGLQPDIIGLGVTGSGRQIAGLHALTDGVINEIVAHAAAAVHFDPEVETIFEIGGQDAKYTWITNRVASDYAMNEACSAGTGSFLEEACLESLGIGTAEIADIALQAGSPPNFSDQCAAFIGSDVKTAVQEGVSRAEATAGLVYAVCQNYLNRVKGNRPVGKKIFMQGGVCYNRAVPAAMALLCGQPIVVPPEPGLMGAFGAALEILRKVESGLVPRQAFDLGQLAGREVVRLEPFICHGGSAKCDRKCAIARIVIDGRTYPFGGACNRYYSLRQTGIAKTSGSDLVTLREKLVFQKYFPPDSASPEAAAVGLLPSLFGATFLPLYAHFFTNLGIRVVVADDPDPGGMEAAGAAFCFPLILSHGFIRELLQRGVNHIFVPHVKNVAIDGAPEEANCTCPFVQGEPYCLNAAFHDELSPRLLTAVLNFQDQRLLLKAFVEIARQLGFSRRQATNAFSLAWQEFAAMRREMLAYGRELIASLRPEETAIILFGRAYNAFSRFGNMGIPHKFASRGYRIIPHDFLPLEAAAETGPAHMFWTTGRQILRAAGQVARHPNLFGVYVTSFSCGPDSFILGYFRERMGQKPSLILELDDHTADAGIDTRIEAFLDIIGGYRQLAPPLPAKVDFAPSQVVVKGGKAWVCTGGGEKRRLTDPAVRVLIPSMGDAGARAVAAAFRYAGIDAVAAEPPGREELKLGKGIATCKECLPLLLTAGTLRQYLQRDHRPGEVLLYFMPASDGPCRLGQYRVFLQNYLSSNRIDNVALLSLSCENSYAGLSSSFTRRAWQAICISDGLDDVYAGILALAEDPPAALAAFEEGKARIFRSIAEDRHPRLLEVLGEAMRKLARFERRCSPAEATRVTLSGEIYVRRDGFSRQHLVERLAARGILVKTAPVSEWLHYTDYCITHGAGATPWEKVGVRIKAMVKRLDEAAVHQRLALSGFYEPAELDMKEIISRGKTLINPELATEAILTASTTLMELGDETHGVISIGPFGCMPCRIAEAVLNSRLEAEKPHFSSHHAAFWAGPGKEIALPFLAIETDGNPFPQVVEARLESFILAAHRLREDLQTMHELL